MATVAIARLGGGSYDQLSLRDRGFQECRASALEPTTGRRCPFQPNLYHRPKWHLEPKWLWSLRDPRRPLHAVFREFCAARVSRGSTLGLSCFGEGGATARGP